MEGFGTSPNCLSRLVDDVVGSWEADLGSVRELLIDRLVVGRAECLSVCGVDGIEWSK